MSDDQRNPYPTKAAATGDAVAEKRQRLRKLVERLQRSDSYDDDQSDTGLDRVLSEAIQTFRRPDIRKGIGRAEKINPERLFPELRTRHDDIIANLDNFVAAAPKRRKDLSFIFRVTADERRILRAIAAGVGLTMANFVRTVVADRVREILQAINEDDSDEFLAVRETILSRLSESDEQNSQHERSEQNTHQQGKEIE